MVLIDGFRGMFRRSVVDRLGAICIPVVWIRQAVILLAEQREEVSHRAIAEVPR